jgi:hypothetical protein
MVAVYVVIHCPTTALKDCVPAELWYKQKPSVGKIKVFRYLAYLKKPKELIGGKFESRTLKYYFLGYCVNGYRLWCPNSEK